MNKPTKTQLNHNWSEIVKLENTVKEVKNLSIKGKVPLKCYQSLKRHSSKLLNVLYEERTSLLHNYNRDMKTYLDWEREQQKREHQLNQSKFEELIATLSEDERALLKKFWHKV